MTQARPVYVAAIDLSCKASFFALCTTLWLVLIVVEFRAGELCIVISKSNVCVILIVSDLDCDSSLGLYVFCFSFRVLACLCCDFAMTVERVW